MIMKKKLSDTKNFYLIIIALYSFLINFYYADFGVFPIDTFLHYDAGFRVLKNEFPVKDFWIVSGFIVDFIQALFFKVFGVSWVSYKIHASTFNLILTIFSFYFFLNLGLSNLNSLIYSICFATLAYTISGTPFVDLHASFFLLLSTFILIIAITNSKKYLWFIVVSLFFLSFLSKQVPFAYAVILQGPIIIYFMVKKMNYNENIFIGFVIFFITVGFVIFLKFLNIDISLFLIEYVIYPSEIGSGRFNFFDISLESFFNKFKFLILPILLCFILQIKTYLKKKKFLDPSNLFKYFLILSLSICLLIHQLMTKNQIYIYFLVPLLFSILDRHINYIFKKNNFISLILLISLILITFKYHLRFNESRKFHELENVKLTDSIRAETIHSSLKGNLWINPHFKGTPRQEVITIKRSLDEIEKVKEEIMLISNYSFLDSITKKNMNTPVRALTLDGTTYPRLDNKMASAYKSFFNEIIKNKNIKKIYLLKHENLPQNIITEYISIECYDYYENTLFKIFEIQCLK